MKKITIGYSPCPNDTFIFDAMVNGRIETGEFIFEPVLRDVEELNRMAGRGLLDITKISVGAYPGVSEHYSILEAGGALGKGVGPLLVSRSSETNTSSADLKVAIPGTHTTANLLLSVFFPHLKNKTEVLFSEIENRVLSGEFDLGLLIHEGRFTYQKKGLYKHHDLGELWETKMNVSLPLGCIGASRRMSASDSRRISELISNSIRHAYRFPEQGKEYIKAHAQEMDEEVIRQHINLYVNEFSITLGQQGKKAIELLLSKGYEAGLLPKAVQPVFNL